jgi:transposase, IS30 family
MSKYTHFSLEERCQIARLHEDGQSIRKIATALDRAPSSIARELKRNRPTSTKPYQPAYADDLAWARRWQGSKLERDDVLRQAVLSRLASGWSPEQVAARLGGIGKETIYRFIYKQQARTKDWAWRHYLPRAKARRGWRRRRGGSPAVHIKGRVSITQRPVPQGPGHFEADTLLFSTYGQAVLVVLNTDARYLVLHKLLTRRAPEVAGRLGHTLAQWPEPLRQTLTVDNGTEFADHQAFGIPTYFCDPHKPWQKGAVENANGRLRRWLPRKTNLNTLSQADLDRVAFLYNKTPRKCLGFKTPAECFQLQLLHFKWDSTSSLSRG